MSTYTRRRHSPQRQMDSNIYTQAQHGVAHQDKLPFPNKPVIHRKPNNPRTLDSIDLPDFGKITINEQPRGCHSNGRDATRSQHPGEVAHKQHIRELKMTRAIQEKQLMLQEKLLRVEAKARQRIERAQQNIALSDDNNQRQEERVKTETKTKLLEQQRREPVRSKGVVMQHRMQEDVEQNMMDSMRNTKDEGEGATWKTQEKDEQFRRKERQGTHTITADPEELSFPDSVDDGHTLLPCKFCNRKFASKRLEKHVLICEKVGNKKRQVFNTFNQRTKGTALRDFLKTQCRSTTPEAVKKKKKGRTSMAHK